MLIEGAYITIIIIVIWGIVMQNVGFHLWAGAIHPRQPWGPFILGIPTNSLSLTDYVVDLSGLEI